jgi:hypothetical protein
MPERSRPVFERPDPSPDDAHDLLPDWLTVQVPLLYTTEEQGDPLVMAKFFTPDARWTWYLTETDGHDLCFGLVDGLEVELGYFSLRDLRALRGPLGLRVERGLSFAPAPPSDVRRDIAERD